MKLSSLFKTRPRRRRVRCYCNSIETCEDRRVLSAANPVAVQVAGMSAGPSTAVTVTHDGSGVLKINGTSGNDDVTVRYVNHSYQVFSGSQMIFSHNRGLFDYVEFEGHAGDDVFRNEQTMTPVRVWGGAGNDQLYAGNRGGDLLRGGDGDDLLVGGTSWDQLAGDAGNDTLLGGGGDDQLAGFDGDDELIGGTGNDSLWGGNGNDVMYGGQGNDFVRGENGNDTLFGGDGNDNLNGNAGQNSVTQHGWNDPSAVPPTISCPLPPLP